MWVHDKGILAEHPPTNSIPTFRSDEECRSKALPSTHERLMKVDGLAGIAASMPTHHARSPCMAPPIEEHFRCPRVALDKGAIILAEHHDFDSHISIPTF